MALSFNICPITGLTFSIKDDSPTTLLYSQVHPLCKEPTTLFTLCEKKAHSIAKSFIVAGILFHLEQEELIEATDKESPYLRGKINELLQLLPRHQLIELYWDTRNCLAHLSSEPLKLNLETTASQGLYALRDNIKAVARQSPSAADMETYIATRSVRSKRERETLNLAKKADMSLKAVSGRIAKLLPSLHNALPTTREIGFPLSSAKKAALFFVWNPETDLPGFAGTNPKIKARLVEILDTLFLLAIEQKGIVFRDSVEANSYQMIRKYLTEEYKTSALDSEF